MEFKDPHDLLDFSGKTVLVTGSSVGIGAGIARRFGQAGADMAIHYHSHAEEAQRLASTLADMGCRTLTVKADEADPSDVQAMVDEVVAGLGKIDVLVMKDDGETDVLQVDLKTATPEIKNQVLNGGDGIRNLGEQKAYLVGKSNQRHQVVKEVETVPWRTYGRKQIIITEANTILSRSDLLSMMKAIEG